MSRKGPHKQKQTSSSVNTVKAASMYSIMVSPHLQNAHGRLQEALCDTGTPPLPRASLLGDTPLTQPPMTSAAVASEPQWRPASLPMDSFSEVRAGAWRLQQIAHQMYLIRAVYPLSDNPYTAEWIRARVRHAKMLSEVEQGLANYHAHGLCWVQYLEFETATAVNDEHEIRVAEGVKTYQVYSGNVVLHYRKVLKFQFVDTLHLGPENHNLYLDPQSSPMGTAHVAGHSWRRDNGVHLEGPYFRPPTPRLHPQIMPMGGRRLVSSPVPLPRPGGAARLTVLPYRERRG